MPAVSSTHRVEIHRDRVVKHFRSWRRDEHLREWRALTLLAEHAPGLAPALIDADLSGRLPAIVMSQVPGLPLAAEPVSHWRARL